MLTASVQFVSSWRELQTYRLAAQELVSSLQVLQSDVRPPAQLQEDLDLSTGQWRRLSQTFAPLCGHLPSYRMLDQSLTAHLQGVGEFRQALRQRRAALARATLRVDASSPATASPEAERAYQKALLESKRQAQPAIQAAKKKAQAALKRAAQYERAAQVARTRLQEAEERVRRAEENQSKSWSGPSAADVFSAEYNSNKNPYEAREAMLQQESVYHDLLDKATTLAQEAQDLRQEVTTLEEESQEKAVQKAKGARQKVWDRFDKARLQAQRDAMNREYLRWYHRVDSQRLEHWDRAAQHLRAAETALTQENTWQALTRRTSKTPLAVESPRRQPVSRSTLQTSPSPTPAATVVGTGILVKKWTKTFGSYLSPYHSENALRKPGLKPTKRFPNPELIEEKSPIP
jgi:hypothetical protein